MREPWVSRTVYFTVAAATDGKLHRTKPRRSKDLDYDASLASVPVASY
ncbi:MAG: hypothetical protein H6682_21335 [Candidatus Eisenbacteria bacterium]|nr:hypothetical protein [Candidatus Eisenbacteria bacterium]